MRAVYGYSPRPSTHPSGRPGLCAPHRLGNGQDPARSCVQFAGVVRKEEADMRRDGSLEAASSAECMIRTATPSCAYDVPERATHLLGGLSTMVPDNNEFRRQKSEVDDGRRSCRRHRCPHFFPRVASSTCPSYPTKTSSERRPHNPTRVPRTSGSDHDASPWCWCGEEERACGGGV